MVDYDHDGWVIVTVFVNNPGIAVPLQIYDYIDSGIGLCVI